MRKVSESDANLSTHVWLIRMFVEERIPIDCFCILFDNLFRLTDSLLPDSTALILHPLYVLARDWEDPDPEFKSAEYALRLLASGILLTAEDLLVNANKV